jgi:hypothetical protein
LSSGSIGTTTAPARQHPVVHEGEVRDVRQHDADAIPRRNMLALENTGDTPARLIELRVADLEIFQFNAAASR